jgi:hypothetical protein
LEYVIAAIYARKGTEQTGVDQRSLARRIGRRALPPAVCDAVLAGAFRALQPTTIAPERARLEREFAAVDAECRRLVQAIATAGDMAS